MSTHNDLDLRAALATLVADEPALPTGADDIERRGRRRRDRRRIAIGTGAAGVLAFGLGGVWAAGAGGPDAPPAAVPGPTSAPADPAGGTGLAEGFPLGSAIDAVAGAGVVLGEIPMDLGWQAGGVLTLPLADGTPLSITVGPDGCTATSAELSASRSAAVAEAVCAAWAAEGSPEIVPAGPPGEERPDLAAR
jgi:hypothetical protein